MSRSSRTPPFAPADATTALRPPQLNPLFAPVATLPGVGPATARALARLLGRAEPRCIDLLAHPPIGFVDPTPRAALVATDEGNMVTLLVKVESHRAAPAGGRLPHRVQARAAGTGIELVFFRARPGAVEARLPLGAERLVHGQLGRFGDRWQIAHPDLLPGLEEDGRLLAVYPLVRGLAQARVRAIIRTALDRAPDLPEWLPTPCAPQPGRLAWRCAIDRFHRPATAADLDPGGPTRTRLALDELVAGQAAVLLVRKRRAARPGRSLVVAGALAQRLRAALPFALTPGQERAVAEIAGDLAAPTPMLRLLQGDVGSGKTAVALMAMLGAVEAGAQAALMAPTEVLALQHAATLAALVAPLGLQVERLTGGETGAQRKAGLARLADGAARLVVGTHALFQPGVAFHDLGLAVIDEHHRFGVAQRLELVDKGRAVDVLLMTATPIPRSLVLAAYGDVAVSRLDGRPPGRRPVTTRAVPSERTEEVIGAAAGALARGERIYWVCPVVEAGEVPGVMPAIERHRQLGARFGAQVGLVHGRMPPAAKAAALAAFVAGDTRLLVATTVVEVGVDVPDAGIIVIEHAERFGLAQLHQLRGRVGRGTKAAACLLLYEPPLTAAAGERLAMIRATEDGFAIAEADLRLRGPGELLGHRQSGLPDTRFADLDRHANLLGAARTAAEAALAGTAEELGALHLLLHLFERPEAADLLAAG